MPHWPNVRASGPAPFPSFTYGQSLMCVTIKTNTSNLLANNLMIDRPYIYDSNISDNAAAQLPAFNSWLDHEYSQALSNISEFLSYDNATFYQFAKSKYWGKDIWDDLVAPYFETPLYVETWRDGSGGRMSSICGPNASSIVEYDIYEIANMEMDDSVAWKGTQDHSKWAIAASNDNATAAIESGVLSGAIAACVGDMNRMCSQENRGGGALCTESAALWTAFNKTVVDLETCFEYYPCGGSGSQCWWCPTAMPTYYPSFAPSVHPTSASPTYAIAVEVTLGVVQLFNNISLTAYESDETSCDKSVQQAVAESIGYGVGWQDVIIDSVTNSDDAQQVSRTQPELAGEGTPTIGVEAPVIAAGYFSITRSSVQSSSSDGITIAYTVNSDTSLFNTSDSAFTAFSTALNDSIVNGLFNTYLASAATANNAQPMMGASSTQSPSITAEAAPTAEPTSHGGKKSGNNNANDEGGDDSALSKESLIIVICIVVTVVLCAGVAWAFYYVTYHHCCFCSGSGGQVEGNSLAVEATSVVKNPMEAQNDLSYQP